MDAECYLIEHMIRDRVRHARERARVAALLVEANGSECPTASKARVTDLGRAVVNGVRKLVGEISHALPGRTRVARHS